ncbi:MAG: FhaA domain-containing protein [Microthrixaceae bacterium]
MGIKGFEGRLERAVEGTFSRLFRSGLSPVEFGRKLVRELDGNRTVGVDGRTLVPNAFHFRVAPADHDQLEDLLGTLRRELADAAREHARDERYGFVGPVEVTIDADERVRVGVLALDARFAEGEGGLPPGSLLLPTGDRVPLGEYVVSVGRQNDCTIVLGDPNVSRHHAEVRPSGDGFVVVDLGSTNGTKVNGARVAEQQLHDGDEVAFGNTVMHFQAS